MTYVLVSVKYFATPVDPGRASSMNLLQCDLALGEVSKAEGSTDLHLTNPELADDLWSPWR